MSLGDRTAVGVLVALLGVSTTAAARGTTAETFVIRPMSSEALRELVAVPAGELPEGVQFDGAQVERTSILVRFRAPDAALRIRLEHPSAQAVELRSRRFGLRFDDPTSAAHPQGRLLLQALARHLRSSEPDFDWAASRGARGGGALRVAVMRALVTWLYLAFALAVLFLGPWLTLRRHRGGAETARRKPRLDRWDLAAAGLILLFAASVAVPLAQLPLLCDEASNLEGDFWSDWFWSPETAAHPPLYRFLIHAIATAPEPQWLIRAPSLFFAILAVWLVFRLAKERAGGAFALAATTALCLSGDFWKWSFVQKSLTLWLCLLLLSYGELSRAVAGEDRRYARFSLFAALACLTHYLSALYVAALCLGAIWKRREAWRDIALALLPAVLVTAPLIVPFLGASAMRGAPSEGGSLARHLMEQAVLTTGLGYLAFAAFAALWNRKEGTADPLLVAMALGGFGATLLMGVISPPLWSRYLFPVLGLGLLWLVSRLRFRPDGYRFVQAAFVIIGVAGLARGGLDSAREVYGRALEPRLHGRYLELVSGPGEGAAPRVVMVHPPCAVQVIGHELTGCRPPPPGLDEPRSPLPALLLEGRWWVGLAAETPPGKLERLVSDLGELDVLWDDRFGRIERRPAGRWILEHCRILVRLDFRAVAHPGAILRCKGETPPPLDPRPALWHYRRMRQDSAQTTKPTTDDRTRTGP